MVYAIFILISFLASGICCICGIGGGVIIKPVMDAFHMYSVSTISFMSGCIVLSMTAYSVIKTQLSHESVIEKGSSTWLGIGAALGGLAGKQLFDIIKTASENPDAVGAVQAAALFALTLATIIYTVNKSKIKTHSITSGAVCAVIGLALGMMSSFLGIGGGPINLVVLYFFFSMNTKTAALNSLYIILFSQITSFLTTVARGRVPVFDPIILVVMAAGGILGGFLGRAFSRKMSARQMDVLFRWMLVLITAISCYNLYRGAACL